MPDIPKESPPPYSKHDPLTQKKGMSKFKKFGIGALVIGAGFMLAPKLFGSHDKTAGGGTNYYT